MYEVKDDTYVVRNVARKRALEWMQGFCDELTGELTSIVTPLKLDVLENELVKTIATPRITRNHIRSEIVCAILDEYSVEAFGLKSKYKKTEISEQTIKKYTRKFK